MVPVCGWVLSSLQSSSMQCSTPVSSLIFSLLPPPAFSSFSCFSLFRLSIQCQHCPRWGSHCTNAYEVWKAGWLWGLSSWSQPGPFSHPSPISRGPTPRPRDQDRKCGYSLCHWCRCDHQAARGPPPPATAPSRGKPTAATTWGRVPRGEHADCAETAHSRCTSSMYI